MSKEQTQSNAAEFIAANPSIKFTVKRVETRPDRDSWDLKSRHFRCTITHNGQSMRFFFSQGCAWTTDPTLENVLQSLALDAGIALSYSDAEELRGGFGYNGTYEAQRVLTACKRAQKNLVRLFGFSDDAILALSEDF